MNESIDKTNSTASTLFVFMTRMALLGGLVSLVVNWWNMPDLQLQPLQLFLLGALNAVGLVFVVRAAHGARPFFRGALAEPTMGAGNILLLMVMGTVAINAMQYLAVALGHR